MHAKYMSVRKRSNEIDISNDFIWIFSFRPHKYLRHCYRIQRAVFLPPRNKFETNFTTICGVERRILQQFFELWFELRDSHYNLRSRYDRLFPSSSRASCPGASFLSVAVVSDPSASSGTEKSQSDKKFILIFTNFKSFAAHPNRPCKPVATENKSWPLFLLSSFASSALTS